MLKNIIVLFGICIILVKPASAFEGNNNKFGIHLAQPHFEDLEAAAQLINSNGGNWGYVTLVIQENDRNKDKWQDIFNRMRKLHLIPIIRLATKPQGALWKRPTSADAASWAEFLNSLNWVIKKRYVVLFNEPNHASEWGGEVDPESYADIAFSFAQRLKEKNSDFFVMLAGFDASAPSFRPTYEDERVFLRAVFAKKPVSQWHEIIDGWVSHAYPNPAFSGGPLDFGKTSIRAYQWELDLLKELGFESELPVFITETGWSDARLSRDTIASYFQTAFVNVWLPDDRVVAVTPFVLDYQSIPFTQFSWKKQGSGEFYPQYYALQSLAKPKGEPEQKDTGIISFDFSKELAVSSQFKFQLKVKNTGQAIWDKSLNYYLALEDFSGGEYFFSDIKDIQPFDEKEITLSLHTAEIYGKYSMRISLYRENKKIIEGPQWTFEVVPLPSFTFTTTLFPKLKTEGDDFELQIFDTNEDLIFKKTGISVEKGKGLVDEIQNIALGDKYRIVLLKPYYLPRQAFLKFKREINSIQFTTMLPFDFNKDGAATIKDIPALFQNLKLFLLFFP